MIVWRRWIFPILMLIVCAAIAAALVKLAFFPKSVDTTETIAYVAYVVLLLIIEGGLYDTWRRKKNNQTTH